MCQAVTLLYLINAASLFLGVITASSVITSEAAIYRREPLVNLSPVAYVVAKVAMLALFAIVQTGLMVAVVAPAIKSTARPSDRVDRVRRARPYTWIR